MAAITILAAGAQGRSGVSAALDVSAYSTLRLDIPLSADMGLEPYVRMYLEAAPAAGGPWAVVWERYFHYAQSWPRNGRERVVVGAPDNFIRVRWEGGRQSESGRAVSNPSEAPVLPNLGFNFGVTGDAI
jgi:hypothetical protein